MPELDLEGLRLAGPGDPPLEVPPGAETIRAPTFWEVLQKAEKLEVGADAALLRGRVLQTGVERLEDRLDSTVDNFGASTGVAILMLPDGTPLQAGSSDTEFSAQDTFLVNAATLLMGHIGKSPACCLPRLITSLQELQRSLAEDDKTKADREELQRLAEAWEEGS